MPLPEGAKEYNLYGGNVRLVFRPDVANARYKVTDHPAGLVDKVVRGVTSTIGNILDKPELAGWRLNMSNKAVFGAIYRETGEYDHNWKESLIKPGVEYDEETLHEIMLEGSRQWTIRSDKGKDVGTMAHNAIEQYLRGEKIIWPTLTSEIPEELREFEENIRMADKACGAFRKWWESLDNPKILDIERTVYSRQLQYAGTFDLLAEINGKVYLLDIKTTNSSKGAPMGIYPEMFLQLGAYNYAFREETGMKVDDVGIIRVGKDGKLNIATAKDVGFNTDECERAFAFAVRLHDWVGKLKPFVSDAYMTSHLNPIQSVKEVEIESANNTKED